MLALALGTAGPGTILFNMVVNPSNGKLLLVAGARALRGRRSSPSA